MTPDPRSGLGGGSGGFARLPARVVLLLIGTFAAVGAGAEEAPHAVFDVAPDSLGPALAGEGLGIESVVEDRIYLAIAAARHGRLDEAERLYTESLNEARRLGRWALVWTALLGLGDVKEVAGDVPGALSYYRRAATLIDTLRARPTESRALAAFADGRSPYEALIHLLTKSDAQFPDSGFVTEAFLWSERARARSLRDLLAESGRAARSAVIPSLDAGQALLARDEIMLVYSLGDSSSSLWALTNDRWNFYRLPPRDVLAAPCAVLRRELAHPDRATSPAAIRAMRRLYELLMGRIESMMRGKRHVIVAADGPLTLVPVEALLTVDVREGESIPRKAHLVEQFDVSYAPSVSALRALSGETRGGGIVALGDPLFAAAGQEPESADLAPLPHTAAELAAIQQVAGKRNIEVLVGAEATRSRFLTATSLADAQVIHLATHGVADPHDPARSGLWLGVEEGGPGFLGVSDILDLDLRASLVTLSACEAGLGRLERGGGVLGLSRAFIAAGARSVVMSLWEVNDESTSRLMERFYRNLLKKKRPRSASLAEAKRKLISKKETRSPFHWAAFVLVGGDGIQR